MRKLIMSLLDQYLPKEYALHGLRRALLPHFAENIQSPMSTLNELRRFHERILYHLSIISGVSRTGHMSVRAYIDKLTSEGVIERQVAPYFHLWWQVSCLGSHFQNVPSEVVSWDEHLDFCRRSVGMCLKWYISQYPPIDLTQQQRRLWLEDASSKLTIPYDQIQVYREDDLEKSLSDNSILVLHGQPWTGKTSIGSYWVTRLCNQGYIPLVIHENSLVTFRILPEDKNSEKPKNLRLASNAQNIHEIIVSRLLYGDSFVVFLDDPFGHRRFRKNNPLMYLRIGDWLKSSLDTHTLGELKIIITTPDNFLKQGQEILNENSWANHIARNNLSVLDEQYRHQVDISQYTKQQIAKIVGRSATHHRCNWAQKPVRVEMVAEELQNKRLGFNALHILCREFKNVSEDEFIEGVIRVTRSVDITNEIKKSPLSAKTHLCAAFVGEALIEFYREFEFHTRLSYQDLCQASLHSYTLTLQEELMLSDWLLEDSVSTMRLSNFSVFSHPEVRFAVESLSKSETNVIVQTIVENIVGLSSDYEEVKLMRWEACHLICRMAAYISKEKIQFVHDEIFSRSELRGGDPRNIIWAILGNWSYIEGTQLEAATLGFLRSLPHNLKLHLPLFIWEATENWAFLNDELKFLVLKLSGNGDTIEELTPTIREDSMIAFLAAGVTQYTVLQENARTGCIISEKYIEFISEIVTMVANNKRKYFSARVGDGLFKTPGVRYSGNDILKQLSVLGRKKGTLNESLPLAIQIDSLLL